MLLYSTRLAVTKEFSREALIRLVEEWNRSTPYRENLIPDFTWHGEENIRYGNDRLWLEIATVPRKPVTAVRYEKQDGLGRIWNTDYIVDHGRQQLVIQLDRTYTDGALRESLAFSTPHFISLLIDHGYLAPDGPLPVQRTPLDVGEAKLPLLQPLLADPGKCALPLVYISRRRDGRPAFDPLLLGSKLKGAAHLIMADAKVPAGLLQRAGLAETGGAVGLYLPHGRRTFPYRPGDRDGTALLERTARAVLDYGNARVIPEELTWNGAKQAILDARSRDQEKARCLAEKELKEAEKEVQDYIAAFDDDQKRLQEQNRELIRQLQSLQQENQGLRRRLDRQGREPVLFLGDEMEFYPGEIREMILDAVEDTLTKGCRPGSRRYDVLKDILQNNPHEHIRAQREETLKQLFKGYRTLTPLLRQALKEMGITITGTGKHYRLTYYGDERYKDTLSKTGSDHREGMNNVRQILNKMM